MNPGARGGAIREGLAIGKASWVDSPIFGRTIGMFKDERPGEAVNGVSRSGERGVRHE